MSSLSGYDVRQCLKSNVLPGPSPVAVAGRYCRGHLPHILRSRSRVCVWGGGVVMQTRLVLVFFSWWGQFPTASRTHFIHGGKMWSTPKFLKVLLKQTSNCQQCMVHKQFLKTQSLISYGPSINWGLNFLTLWGINIKILWTPYRQVHAGGFWARRYHLNQRVAKIIMLLHPEPQDFSGLFFWAKSCGNKQLASLHIRLKALFCIRNGQKIGCNCFLGFE